jgi:hypothetical protein
MPDSIPIPPNSFEANPLGGKWFNWRDIEACFRPRAGKDAIQKYPELQDIGNRGGVYVMAWSLEQPKSSSIKSAFVKYIGGTGGFKERMKQFRQSAGLCGQRQNGHSGGWRWPEGKCEHLWIAFFEFGADLPAHLTRGLRCWMEGVALEEHMQTFGSLPQVNDAADVVEFSAF